MITVGLSINRIIIIQIRKRYTTKYTWKVEDILRQENKTSEGTTLQTEK